MHSLEAPITNPVRRPWLVLAVVCLSVYVLNLSITIVNVALPAFVAELGATNRDLQWIVDAYNLTFAGFVLAAGSLADRYGRRGALIVGLTIFGVGAVAGAMVADVGALVVARLVMGLGAAVIFPTTLSIIAHSFPDRRLRARAIGIWGAITGVGVATGPLIGGLLLERFWWGSVFAGMVPIALAAIVLTLAFVPTSRDPATPRLDHGGQLLSIALIGVLVYAIIEAPVHGWLADSTLLLFGASGLFFLAFVVWERTRRTPMLDVRLFANLRFSAACLSVTVAFFSLFGFILLITLYFQYFRGLDPFAYGLALTPVATAIAVGSVLGVLLAIRYGGRWVVAGGLALMSAFFVWVSTISTATDYWPTIVGQMIVGGLGLGLTTAPATETIMDVVPVEKAAVGSAMNDATRELGGTLGVAVVGSVFASAYAAKLTADPAIAVLPAESAAAASDSVGAALQVAANDPGGGLLAAVDSAFYAGLAPACIVAGLVSLVGALLAAVLLPSGHPQRDQAASADHVPAGELVGPGAGQHVPVPAAVARESTSAAAG